MRFMLMVAVVMAGSCAGVQLQAAEAAEIENISAPAEPAGMQSLFDGSSLEGWDGDPRLWSVRDGVIHGETTEENATKGNTFLIWQGGDLGDFELRLSFRCTADNNSGIQYRSQHITEGSPRNAWVVRAISTRSATKKTSPTCQASSTTKAASGGESAWLASGPSGRPTARK